MAYHHVCDRCGANLDHASSYYRIIVETHKNRTISFSAFPPSFDQAKTKDYCRQCFNEIEELASSPNASVSYNTPGAR